FGGVVPMLPVVEGEDRGALWSRIKEVRGEDDLFPVGASGQKDVYWTAKSLGKIALLAQLSDEIGHPEARADFVQALENELEDWFDGRTPKVLYYDRSWASLIASPSAYGSSAQLNDHHF